MIRKTNCIVTIFSYLYFITPCSSFTNEGKTPKEIDIPKDNAAEREELSALLLSSFLHSNSKAELLDEDVFTETASQQSQLSEGKTCGCCKRKENIAAIGFDITGNERYADIGRCQHTCKHHHHRRHDNSTTVKQLFPTLRGFDVSQNRIDVCRPLLTKIQTQHFQTGPVDVELVDSCHCVSKREKCSRVSHRVLLFENSTFEVEVDVGACEGGCRDNHRCFPLRNRSVSVEGPNGAKCVEVIEECQCSTSCFRMAFMESFYEWIWNKTSNVTEERIRDIDVGRCVGGCEDFEDQFQCVLRDPSDSKRCLMSLRKSAPRCVPVQFSTHSFSTKDGALKTVLAVDQCGC
ncbi:uncharacterized protein LOC143229515 [Tachypleus tridentatus]|uniref:uncharacterized protein LOC143229515 n=1 Tax=Tachypleus tridentatus TaxID=6853 RepID=UPI003FD4C968